MGSKFANIHIPNLDNNDFAKELSDVELFLKSKDGYYIIVNEDYNIEDIVFTGKQLSKQLKTSLMTVGYYDDDVLELTILDKGKLVTQYTSDSYMGLSKKNGNEKLFCDYLGCNEDCARLFKAIQSCEDLEKQTDLLEALIGVPIWLNFEMACEYEEGIFHKEYAIEKVEEFAKEVEKEKEFIKKLKNKYKAKLLYESKAMYFMSYGNNGKDAFFALTPQNDEGRFPHADTKIYIADDNEVLKQLDLDIRGIASQGLGMYMLCHSDYLGLVYHRAKSNFVAVIDARDSTLLYTYERPEMQRPVFLMEDGAVVFKGLDNIYFCDRNRNEWSLRFQNNSLYKYENYLFVVESSDIGYYTIHKINTIGKILASQIVKDNSFSSSCSAFFDNDGNLYFVMNHSVTKYDNALSYINSVNVPETIIDEIYSFNKVNNMLYIMTLNNGLYVIGTKNMGILYVKKNMTGPCLDKFTSSNDVVFLRGDSSLDIYDSSMQLVSRHRLKGLIMGRAYRNKRGNVCIVTTDSEYKEVAKRKFRVYELL